MWGHGLDRSGSRWGQVADSCEWGNKPLASVKCTEIYLPDENLLASQEGLCTMELDIWV